ncbi:Fasciculation and elongation protein zeta-2 [Holothuria leucospilota]|uniref:Fasciculation and elongation protein zeta-2 n=1 Tax=Holothuria leucospilota TaxID=206669 RepID=A0A9Q1CJK4_HOLLE|nr:Fasciculation and elongation protein zeta-2 [Holothuria leucospilota]
MPGEMKTTNMAAPIAVFEENSDPNPDEWPSEFIDYRSPTTMDDMLNSNGESFPVLSPKEEISPDNFCEMKTSSSIEDLVNNFEEKLAVCFRNYDFDTERFAPVQVLTKEELMRNSKLWKEMTEHMGQVMPLDWETSKTRELHLPSLNLSQRRVEDHSLDLPEDDDLAQSLDMHSMVLSGSTTTPVDEEDGEEYPVVTAEQVIEELDEMFQCETSPDEPPEEDRLSSMSRELQALRERSLATGNYEEGNVGQALKEMDLAQLNELLEELDNTFREFSEILVQQLALREEMEDEKEMKNMFIASLLSVQNKIKSKNGKGKGKSEGSSPGGLAGLGLISRIKGKNGLVEPGYYLTTRIPYNKGDGPPDLDTLRMLTKILRAIDVDSKEVPDLLTNYILKVLFPSGTEEGQTLPAPDLTQR